jgi:small-conductance mechanosensitive channel/CRP-like cAMP-binding protein
MLDTINHLRFSWAQVVVGFVGLFCALALTRVAVGRQHRRRIFVMSTALALSILLHLVAIAIDVLVPGSADRFFHAAAVLLLAFGLTGLLGLVLLDLLFQRAGLSVPTILRDILQAVAFFIILLVVLSRSGVNLLSLVTTSAVLTAVIGLALQNTISNMFAGLALQMDRTLNVGDWIQMSHWIGRITHIKWRSTFIVTRDGNNVILPNSELLRQEVLNYSKPSGEHRNSVKVSFAYRHPPREVARILLDSLRGLRDILAEPAPDCIPLDFGESGIVYAVRYWTDNVFNDQIVEGEVRTRIWYAAQRAGLEIPYPVRSVRTLDEAPERRAADEARERQACVDALAAIDLFAKLDQDELDLLASGVRSQRFADGEVIIEQGDVGDSLYLITRGEVAVTLTVDTQVREVARLAAGGFVGEMSLLTGEPRQATCRAVGDVACWVLGHQALQRVLRADPKAAEHMSTVIAGRQQALAGERATLIADRPDEPTADQRLLKRIRDFFNLN